MAEGQKENLDSQTEEEEEIQDDLENAKNSEEKNKELDAEALKQKNKDLYARAKKAEGELKKHKDAEAGAKKPEKKPVLEDELIDKKIDEVLRKRDLDSLDLSPELKKEVRNYAKLNQVSIQEAVKSDYIQFKKGQEEQKIREEEASAGSSKKGSAWSTKDFNQMSIRDFDMSTEGGRKGWEEYKKWLKSQG